MLKKIIALLIALPAFLSACGQEVEEPFVPEQPAPRLYSIRHGTIATGTGEVLFLKGINVSNRAKYEPDFVFHVQQTDIDAMLGSGINSVRLLTFWRAIAPAGPAEFDEHYLNILYEQARKLEDAGMYIVLDMHQDVWGHPFSGHGAPAWACPKELKQGYEPSTPWWINYTKPQVIACFDNFYASEELQDAFADAWAEVAAKLCPIQRILGYDLFNEPFPGSKMGEPDFDDKVLVPLYLKVIERIEQNCPQRLYFLEPNISYQMGLSHPFDIPENILDRVVFSPHFYPRDVHEPNTNGYDRDFVSLEKTLRDLVEPYLGSGTPVWIGEYGGITDNPNFDSYIRDLHSLFHEYFISSALWDFSWSDSGFSFLNSEHKRKPVFDNVFSGPVVTMFPSKPFVYTVNWENHALTASFDCITGRCLQVSSGTSMTCRSSLEGVLNLFHVSRSGTTKACCKQSRTVTVECGPPDH